jgi:hypothetical protein
MIDEISPTVKIARVGHKSGKQNGVERSKHRAESEKNMAASASVRARATTTITAEKISENAGCSESVEEDRKITCVTRCNKSSNATRKMGIVESLNRREPRTNAKN